MDSISALAEESRHSHLNAVHIKELAMLALKCFQVGFLKYRSEIYLVVLVFGDVFHSAQKPV